jgi:4-hydroxy-tetrahydrodipicolinate reductase
MAKASGPIPVAIMGLGFIGREIARAALASPELALVAAVDSAPSLHHKPLAELVPGAPKSLRVEPDAARVLANLTGGVLLHATGSRFEEVYPQLEAAARCGVHVVSTCEELAFPWLHFEEKADALDRLAKSRKACLLGTGVNPGFVLDRLVATAGAVCGHVRHIHAVRVVDASGRREALQRRIGMGMSEDEFARRAEAGKLGHVGLEESAALCALGLGLDCDEFEEDVDALIADEDFAGVVPVKKGQVAGVYQRARGFLEGRQIVELELTIAAGVEESYDLIELDAEPKVRLKVEGGYPGETATAWAVVNAAPRLLSAEPGLLTVLELPAGR